jgi:cytochrome P450
MARRAAVKEIAAGGRAARRGVLCGPGRRSPQRLGGSAGQFRGYHPGGVLLSDQGTEPDRRMGRCRIVAVKGQREEAGMVTSAAADGCPVGESFDPFSSEYLADPYLVMATMPLDETPVIFAPSIGYYVITRYADIEQVFGDPDTYSAAVAQAPLTSLVAEAQRILLAGGHKPQPSMVSLDEPAHARLRKPAARAFSMKRVTAMIPDIEATTARLLDSVGETEEFDLVAALAFPLPANIVFSLMGAPARDYPQLKQWCGYRAVAALVSMQCA